jgi:amino acid transporter
MGVERGKSSPVFLREATGLTRELSTARATFFNIAGSFGNGYAYVVAWVSLGPIIPILGLPLYNWAIIFGALFSIGYILCLVVLTHIMPRTGGDYVFTSRILHPFLGFIEGWTTILFMAATMGYNGWAATFNIGNMLTSAVVYGSQYASLGAAVTAPSLLIGIGVVEFILAFLMVVSPPRMFYRILNGLVIIALVSGVCLLIPLLGISPAVFAANFEHYTGLTPTQVIQTATANGWDPNAPISLAAVMSMFGFSLWYYVGFTNSTYLGGEIRGKVGRNVAISTGIALLIGLLPGFLDLPYLNAGGYNFLIAWGYLFYNVQSKSPLGTIPTTLTIDTIGNPSLAGVALVASFFPYVVFNFLVVVSCLAMATRIIFAQSMDRMLPKKLADVSSRTNEPVYGLLVLAIVGFGFYALTVLGISPISTTYYAVLIGFFAMLFPAVNGILVKWRKPDLFKTAPSWATRRFLRLPIVAWAGIFWLAFLLPIWVVETLWGIVSSIISAPPSTLFASTYSSGVLLAVVIVIIGAILYFAEVAYNTRKGYDLKLVFQEIPPE